MWAGDDGRRAAVTHKRLQGLRQGFMILRAFVGLIVGAVGGTVIGSAVFLVGHLIRPFSFMSLELGWPAPVALAALLMVPPGTMVGAAVGLSASGVAYGAVIGAVVGGAYIAAFNLRPGRLNRDLLFVITMTALLQGLTGAAVAACLGRLFPQQ
jgi:hypothetical protein